MPGSGDTSLPLCSRDTWAEEPELSEAGGERADTAGHCASSVLGEPWAPCALY